MDEIRTIIHFSRHLQEIFWFLLRAEALFYMILQLENILTPEILQTINHQLEEAKFIDGKKTAGWHAVKVKNNEQLSNQFSEIRNLEKIIYQALNENIVFQMATIPKKIHSLRFSRYSQGMGYGSHVDDALMKEGRTDISFTIFLNSPQEYEGGELILEEVNEERSFKLSAGTIIFYPSYSLHRVETVTKGVRKVVVGWIESWIRDVQKREILFDLDTVRRSIFHKQGKTAEFDLLSKSYSNLLRFFADS